MSSSDTAPRSGFRQASDEELFRQWLDSDRTIEIEVGSGKGLFLIQAAQQHPETYFFGLEIAAKYAALAQSRLEREGLTNARCSNADAVEVMDRAVPPDRLAAVHVYFPDPWWKARHKKRRVLNERMLRAIERALRPGAWLHVWTDVVDYYESTLELVAQVTKLSPPVFVDEPPSAHDMDYRTHFERRTRRNGLPVYRSQFQKQ